MIDKVQEVFEDYVEFLELKLGESNKLESGFTLVCQNGYIMERTYEEVTGARLKLPNTIENEALAQLAFFAKSMEMKQMESVVLEAIVRAVDRLEYCDVPGARVDGVVFLINVLDAEDGNWKILVSAYDRDGAVENWTCAVDDDGIMAGEVENDRAYLRHGVWPWHRT